MKQFYVGVDIHKHACVHVTLDSAGKVMQRGRFANTVGGISDFARTLTSHSNVVVEPVLNYELLVDEFAQYAASVHVATPSKVRVIAESKCKTDRYDARILADLLRTDYLPESYVAPRALRDLRTRVRQRFHLVKTIVMFKNRIRHLLFLEGVKLTATDVSSVRGRREIRHACLSETVRACVAQCLQIITPITEQVAAIDAWLTAQCQDVAAYHLLQTIPGIGLVWAATLYAEIGDVHRFRSGKALAGYSGLVPIVRASGHAVYYGGITRTGSRFMRMALVEAALRAARRSPRLNRLYQRVLYRGNVQKARVAVARKLAVIIYSMLTTNQPFRAADA
jgi:transposase